MTYKELINNLIRHYPNKYWVCDAVDVIKQLVKERDELVTKCHGLEKERDAAVADLKDAASFPCRFCKKHTEDCDCYTAYDKWEWRGVQEVEHEID